MKMWKTILAATALALASSSTAFAARTDLVLGIVLEPPKLDPTAGAAEAIDEIVYANVFEGLTRIDERRGAAGPRRNLDRSPMTARPTRSSCTRA